MIALLVDVLNWRSFLVVQSVCQKQLEIARIAVEHTAVALNGSCHRKERKGSGTCIAHIVSNSTTKRSDVVHTVTCKYTTS